MSTAPLRSGMVPVSRQMRAYFAPVDRTTETPTIFDPAVSGTFSLDDPPSPWIDLGWVDNFERSYGTPTDGVRAGSKGLAALQFRGPLEARVDFDFRQWGKLQMALAGGSEHMNVLATVESVTPAPSGGTPQPAVAVLAGSSATEIILGPGAVGDFPVGSVIAVDLDYAQQIGFVGSGITAAYVSDPLAVRQDVNYVRRVTFNVSRVAELTATSAILSQPLLAGIPTGAGVQQVVAFVDREGGSFFQEWSAIFIAEEESGGRACFYYPRLSPNPVGRTAGGTGIVRENLKPIEKPLNSISLRASFAALPYTDVNDGQAVLCFRSYFPAAMAAVY